MEWGSKVELCTFTAYSESCFQANKTKSFVLQTVSLLPCRNAHSIMQLSFLNMQMYVMTTSIYNIHRHKVVYIIINISTY